MMMTMDSFITDWMRQGIIVVTGVCCCHPWKRLLGQNYIQPVIIMHLSPLLALTTNVSQSYWDWALFYDFISWTLDGQVQSRSENLRGQQIVDGATCLALTLTYMCTRGSVLSLQAFLGLTAMPLVIVKPTSGKAGASTNAMVNSQDEHTSTQAINNTNMKSNNIPTVTMTTRLAVG
jgi:hypothetical protein